MSAADLRALLAAGWVTHVPGIYDPATAVLAVRAGHRAVHLSAAAVAATMLGRSDLGFAPVTQIADRAAVLAPALGGVPLLADVDAGYDSPEHAVWTALAYQRAGIGGVCLDDGDDARQAGARIAVLAAQAPEVALVARAGGAELPEIIARCRAYAEAGADAVLVPDTLDEDFLVRVHAALPGVPLAVSRSETVAGGSRLSDAELAGLGVRLVLHPLAAVLAALRAASLVYRAIADEGHAARVDRIPPAVFATLTDQPGRTGQAEYTDHPERTERPGQSMRSGRPGRSAGAGQSAAGRSAAGQSAAGRSGQPWYQPRPGSGS